MFRDCLTFNSSFGSPPKEFVPHSSSLILDFRKFEGEYLVPPQTTLANLILWEPDGINPMGLRGGPPRQMLMKLRNEQM